MQTNNELPVFSFCFRTSARVFFEIAYELCMYKKRKWRPYNIVSKQTSKEVIKYEKIYIAIGTSFLLNGRRFEITEELEGDVFLAKDLSFEGVTEKFKLNDLLKQLEVGNLIFAVREKNNRKQINLRLLTFLCYLQNCR